MPKRYPNEFMHILRQNQEAESVHWSETLRFFAGWLSFVAFVVWATGRESIYLWGVAVVLWIIGKLGEER